MEQNKAIFVIAWLENLATIPQFLEKTFQMTKSDARNLMETARLILKNGLFAPPNARFVEGCQFDAMAEWSESLDDVDLEMLVKAVRSKLEKRTGQLDRDWIATLNIISPDECRPFLWKLLCAIPEDEQLHAQNTLILCLKKRLGQCSLGLRDSQNRILG